MNYGLQTCILTRSGSSRPQSGGTRLGQHEPNHGKSLRGSGPRIGSFCHWYLEIPSIDKIALVSVECPSRSSMCRGLSGVRKLVVFGVRPSAKLLLFLHKLCVSMADPTTANLPTLENARSITFASDILKTHERDFPKHAPQRTREGADGWQTLDERDTRILGLHGR